MYAMDVYHGSDDVEWLQGHYTQLMLCFMPTAAYGGLDKNIGMNC